MAVEITLDQLIFILLGIFSAIGGAMAWVLKQNTDSTKRQTRIEDRTYRNEQDIAKLETWLKEERAEAKAEHNGIREELRALSKSIHTIEGKLK